MSRQTAVDLWGFAVVRRALDETNPDSASPDLLDEIKRHSDPSGTSAGEFARWALTLPWPRFCAVVRIVSGVTKEEMLGE